MRFALMSGKQEILIMAIIHIRMENGIYIARGYGEVYSSKSPIGAYIGVKLMRMYTLGLIGNKYPFMRLEWISIMVKELSKKYSHDLKMLNKRLSTKRAFLTRC
ncbi:hypothetical protein DVF56_07690 [Salmonella enterica subsp. enterica serovar Newport]|nr:hypothetical protein [Salmonella enterica subsp. enterica serovar Newport]EBY2764839.1 hypothetical protein [Salmonella enterica subsp. enterica serovar Newport]EBY4191346.1 hypothetical protein [Salmonella enterica subsp. enterica serovar Newport]